MAGEPTAERDRSRRPGRHPAALAEARGFRSVRRGAAGWGLALGLLAALSQGGVAASADPALGQRFEALALTRYAPGTLPPDFEGVTTEGVRVSLSGLRGRVVLLNFWASWCPECRVEMPGLEGLHSEFARDGLTVLGVNLGETPAVVRRYAAEMGLTFPMVLDRAGQIQRAYGVIGLPTSFLIGRDGQALARVIGPREWGSREAQALIRVLLETPSRGR